MPIPSVLPTMTARPKPTPRMRIRPRGVDGVAVTTLSAPCYIEYALRPMDHRRLGSTGLRISRLGLGCGNFGGIGSAPEFFGMGENEAQACELMDRALDAGINFFDTANAYGGGRSETYIGNWLKTKGSTVSQRLLVSSKVFNPVGPGPNDRGLSRRHILQQVDESLARLQTDRLDMYLIHEPDPETPLEETLVAL